METKIKQALLLLVISALPFVFFSCTSMGDDGMGYTETEFQFNFKLANDSTVFKSVYYDDILEGGFYQSSQTPWRLILDRPTTKVVFETSNGWDTLVYRVVLSGPSPNNAYRRDKLTIEMENPEILYHTFDSVYYQEVSSGYNSGYYIGYIKEIDVNLILIK